MDKIKVYWKIFKKNKLGIFGLGVLLFFIFIALLAPVLPISNPTLTNPQESYLPPSYNHLFGTNGLGQDVLSQCIWGTQISLIVGFFAAAIIIIIGLIIGMISGYYGGFIDEIFMRITDFFLVLPSLALMIIVGALFGSSLLNVILIIGLLSWPSTARIVRSMTLSLREFPFVEAVKAANGSNIYIIFKHIMPNVIPVIIATAILNISGAIFTQASLVFLGVGDVTDISWGAMIHNAFDSGDIIGGYWWTSFFPGLFLVLLILGFIFLSRSLEEILNPRMRRI